MNLSKNQTTSLVGLWSLSRFLRNNPLRSSERKVHFFCFFYNVIGSRALNVPGFSIETLSGRIEACGTIIGNCVGGAGYTLKRG